MTATIRVRVNPANNGEYVVYLDPEDPAQPWVRAGGAVIGWEYGECVEDWPEFELPIPGAADPDLARSGSPPKRPTRRERLHVCRGSG